MLDCVIAGGRPVPDGRLATLGQASVNRRDLLELLAGVSDGRPGRGITFIAVNLLSHTRLVAAELVQRLSRCRAAPQAPESGLRRVIQRARGDTRGPRSKQVKIR